MSFHVCIPSWALFLTFLLILDEESQRDFYDFDGFHLYTPSDEPLEIHNTRINREEKIHMPLIESWLRLCEDEHPDCNKAKFARSAETSGRFHLIDVVAQQIVPGTLSTPFIPLSYVWGGAKQLQLTKMLYPELTQHQGPMKYQDMIPATIKDAMTVVSGLNERYLGWTVFASSKTTCRTSKCKLTRWLRSTMQQCSRL
jgi:hypothetical protein